MISGYTVHQLITELLEELPGVELADFFRITNQEIGKLSVEYPWRHFQSTYRFSTVAPYSTGTVSVTNGDATLTGSGTTFTSGMVGRKFKLDNSATVYEIVTFTDTTHVELDRVVTEDSDSALEYKIWQDTYSMPSDLWRMLQVQDVETQYKLREYGPQHANCLAIGIDVPRAYKQWGIDDSGYPEIIIDGIPTEARPLQVTYWRKPSTVTAPSSTPDLPVHLHEALKLSVLLVYMRRHLQGEDAMMRRQEIKMDLANAITKAKKQDAQFTRPQFRNVRVMF